MPTSAETATDDEAAALVLEHVREDFEASEATRIQAVARGRQARSRAQTKGAGGCGCGSHVSSGTGEAPEHHQELEEEVVVAAEAKDDDKGAGLEPSAGQSEGHLGTLWKRLPKDAAGNVAMEILVTDEALAEELGQGDQLRGRGLLQVRCCPP